MSRHALASSLAAIALLHTQCVGASTPNVAAAAPPPPGLSVNFAADFSSYVRIRDHVTVTMTPPRSPQLDSPAIVRAPSFRLRA